MTYFIYRFRIPLISYW